MKHEELSDARVVSVTVIECGFAVHFLQRFLKSWEDNIWLIIKCDLFKFSFIQNFHNTQKGLSEKSKTNI